MYIYIVYALQDAYVPKIGNMERKNLYMNVRLNRPQLINGSKSIKLNLSDYNIGYILSISRVSKNGLKTQDYIPFVFKSYENSLTIPYREIYGSSYEICIDYCKTSKAFS